MVSTSVEAATHWLWCTLQAHGGGADKIMQKLQTTCHDRLWPHDGAASLNTASPQYWENAEGGARCQEQAKPRWQHTAERDSSTGRQQHVRRRGVANHEPREDRRTQNTATSPPSNSLLDLHMSAATQSAVAAQARACNMKRRIVAHVAARPCGQDGAPKQGRGSREMPRVSWTERLQRSDSSRIETSPSSSVRQTETHCTL